MPTIDLTNNEARRSDGGDPARHRGRQVPPRAAPRPAALGAGEARSGDVAAEGAADKRQAGAAIGPSARAMKRPRPRRHVDGADATR
jgi:hypothetical protein